MTQAARSRQGKMEKSLLSFATTYPGWEPGAAEKQMLSGLQLPAPGAAAGGTDGAGAETDGGMHGSGWHAGLPPYPFTAHLGITQRPGVLLTEGPHTTFVNSVLMDLHCVWRTRDWDCASAGLQICCATVS